MIMHLEIVFILKEIQLPKSLKKIDFKKVFENCKEVKIEIEEENEYCKIEDDDVCSKMKVEYFLMMIERQKVIIQC